MTATGGARRFAVAPEQVPALQQRIAAINRRAARAGGAGVTLTAVDGAPDGLVWLELAGELEPLGRWDVVCVLRHTDNAETRIEPLRPINADEQEALRAARGHCQACRTVRPRSTTFLVRERLTGRTVQLGSSCVRAFTGADQPAATLRQAEAIATAGAELAAASHPTNTETAYREGHDYIDTEAFLAHAVACVREHRFVAASAPADAGPPTWQTAAERLAAAAEPSRRDLQRARDIRAWVANIGTLADDGTYQKQLAQCVAADRLTPRELRRAAAAVRAYNRHLAREISDRHTQRQTQTTPRDRGAIEDLVDTVAFLACAAAAVRDTGFVRASADGDPPATWRVALTAVAGTGPAGGNDLQRAHQIRKWAAQTGAVAQADSFERKLAVCLAETALSPRDLPIAAAAVRNYNRHLAKVIAARRRGT